MEVSQLDIGPATLTQLELRDQLLRLGDTVRGIQTGRCWQGSQMVSCAAAAAFMKKIKVGFVRYKGFSLDRFHLSCISALAPAYTHGLKEQSLLASACVRHFSHCLWLSPSRNIGLTTFLALPTATLLAGHGKAAGHPSALDYVGKHALVSAAAAVQ